MVTVRVSCDNVVDLVLLKGDGDEECSDCDGLVILVVIIVMVMVKEDVHAVMVTVMLVVVSVHHQVMSDVRTVTETELNLFGVWW
jgi:hypothetical protein